jgi:hypothetical protein
MCREYTAVKISACHAAAPGGRVIQQAHLPEVSLHLGARLAVSHRHRALAGSAAIAQHLQRIAVQRPLRHHHALAGQQLPSPHHGQAVAEQLGQPPVMSRQQRPGLPTPAGPVRPDLLGHRAQQLIAELGLAPSPVQTAPGSRLHIPAGGLAVHLRQPCDRAEPFAPQPQAQHLFDLVHANLPERHRCPPRSAERSGSECRPGSRQPSLPRTRAVP